MKLTVFYFDPTVNSMFVEKTDETGNTFYTLSSPYNFVYRDEIVARVIDVDDPSDVVYHLDTGYKYYQTIKFKPFKAGDGIIYDTISGCYRATDYGFVTYDQRTSRINLKLPLQVKKDKLKAFYIIFPTKFLKIPTYKDIEQQLLAHKIIGILDKTEIESQLNGIDINNPKVHRILVARGKEPMNGYDDYYVSLIPIEKKAGKLLDDGRIDFKEVGTIIEIKKGQDVLQRIPGIKPEDGFDIYGEKVEATIEQKEGYYPGKNIVPSSDDPSIYISQIDGCLDIDNKNLSVLPVAIIKGDVNYESGNIDFDGSVQIMGSILPGFTVNATGDVYVDKNIDDAKVTANGDIIVKLGIGGKGDSKIIAGGNVKAKFILNSYLEALGKIEIEDSIINSTAFSNDDVVVSGRHGKIIGGETIARHQIVVNVAGSQMQNITKLTAGKSLIVERELADLRKQMGKYKSNVDDLLLKIKNSFGEGVFENPKEFLNSLPPIKKKNCLMLLKELSENNHQLKLLLDQRMEIENKYKLEKEPSISIIDIAYPGVIISIKKSKMQLEKSMQNTKFYEDAETKRITFTAAV
ncbi:MAG TPA: FapA family protein [Spirochaetota bacterium]|nr:FapA family protein [Spirochaetota bacterium]